MSRRREPTGQAPRSHRALDGPSLALVRTAERVSLALQRALPPDSQQREDLEEVLSALSALHDEALERTRLHRALRSILVACAPFRASLWRGAQDEGEQGRQTLLQNWRPIQNAVDRLLDLCADVVSTGHPFRRLGEGITGERWMVDVAALQAHIEEALREEEVDVASLLELTQALESVCERELDRADRALQWCLIRASRISDELRGVDNE